MQCLVGWVFVYRWRRGFAVHSKGYRPRKIARGVHWPIHVTGKDIQGDWLMCRGYSGHGVFLRAREPLCTHCLCSVVIDGQVLCSSQPHLANQLYWLQKLEWHSQNVESNVCLQPDQYLRIGPTPSSRWSLHNTPGKSYFPKVSLLVQFENGHEGTLGNIDIAHGLHAFFTSFLFFQQFSLTRNITTITLGGHVFPHGR